MESYFDNYDSNEEETIIYKNKYDFYKLQSSLCISSKKTLFQYLNELFYHLALRNPLSNSKLMFINKTTFVDYMNLSLPISEKLYNVFLNGEDKLTLKLFVDTLLTLYTGTIENIIQLIFSLFDFNCKNECQKNDCRLLLGFITVKRKKNQIQNYLNQKNFQEELDKIIKAFFTKNSLNLKEFTNQILNGDSDIFICMISYIYYRIPFSTKSIDFLNTYKVVNITNINNKVKSEVEIPIIKECYLILKYKLHYFYESSVVLERDCNVLKLVNIRDSPPSSNQKEINSPIKSRGGKNDIVSEFDKISPKKVKIKNSISGGDIDIKKSVSLKFAKDIPGTKSKTQSKKSSANYNDEDYQNIDSTKLSENIDFSNILKLKSFTEKKLEGGLGGGSNEIEMEAFLVEGFTTPTVPKFKRIYIKCIENDIFLMRDSMKDTMISLFSIRNYYVNEIEIKNYSKLIYSCITFSLIGGQKSTDIKTKYVTDFCFYFTHKENANNFHFYCKNALKQKKVTDKYELKEILGEGAFGQVRKAIEKITNKTCAVKIQNISNMDSKQYEYLRNEIDILKHCFQVNISELYDIYEDRENIYIVMEFLPGIDLFSFLDEKFFLKEEFIRHIALDICNAIKYLHSYGIVHRDLKLDNLIINIDGKKTINNGNKEIRDSKKSLIHNINPYIDDSYKSTVSKLTDFGISKVIGNDEYLNDGIGTLRFSAPEILNGNPYNKQIDIWSFGVCIYLLFCGEYPFEDEDKNLTTKRILYEELKFTSEIWSTASESFKNLIIGCLEKDPKKRLTISKVLKHSFFNQQI